MTGGEAGTRRVVDALYEAYLAGDQQAMLRHLSDDVHVRFLGQVDVTGMDDARRFFDFAGGLLRDLDFRIGCKIIDGEWAAVTWSETGYTASGKPWENHGVDVIRVVDSKVVSLHENNDVRMVRRHFPSYPPTKGR